MVLTDAYRHPFSLFVGSRNSPGECSVERTGNVVETMDSSIGRSVLKVKGSVSANNYVDFSGVNLVGHIVYIQLSLMKPAIATFHIELVTTGDVSLRLTFSTLYEQPRFLGRSLRLPLPPRSGWANLFFDIDQVLQLNCPAVENGTPWKLKAIKRIQLCSNMLVRDVVTSNAPIIPNKNLPKELGVIASANLPWINISTGAPESLPVTESENIPPFSPEADLAKKIFFADSPADTPASTARRRPKSAGKNTPVRTATPGRNAITPGRGHAMTPGDLDAFKDTVKSAVSGSATPGPGNHASQTHPVLQLEHVNSYAGGAAVLLYGGSMMVLASGSLIVLIDLYSTDSSRPVIPQTGLWRYFRAASAGEVSNRGGYNQTFLRGHSSPIGIIEQSSDGLYLITCETCAGGKLFLWNLQDGRRVATLRPHLSSIACASISDDNSQLVTAGGDASGRVQLIVWDIQSLILSCIPTNSGNASEVAEAKKNMVVAKQLSDFPIQKIGFSPFQDKGLVSCGRENIRFWRIKKGHMPGRPVQLNEYSRGFIFTDFSFYADISKNRGKEQPLVFVASSKGMLLRVDCAKEQVLCAYQLHSGAICSMAVGDGVVITGGEDSRLRVWPLNFNDFLMEAHHESAVTHVNISGEGGKFLSVGTISGTLGVLNVFEHSYRTVLRSHVGAITALSASTPLGDETLSLGDDGTIRLWDNMSGTQKFEFNSPDDHPLCGVYHPVQHVIACGFQSGAVRIFDVQTTSTIFERSLFTAIGSHGSGATHSSPPCPIACVRYSPPPSFSDDSAGDSRGWVKGLRLFGLSVDGRVTVFDVDSGYQPIRSVIVCPMPSSLISTSPEAVRSPNHPHTSNVQREMFMSVGAGGTLLAVASGDALSTMVVVDTDDLAVLFKAGSHGDSSGKKAVGAGFHHSTTGFTGSVKYGVSYPTSSPYYQQSKNPENDSSPEDTKDQASGKGYFGNTATTTVQPDSTFVPGGKSDRRVIGLEFVSDPGGCGEYLTVFTPKHMIVVAFGESSAINSAVSSRRTAKVANIPTMLLPHEAQPGHLQSPDMQDSADFAHDFTLAGDTSSISQALRRGWDNRTIKQLLVQHHRPQASMGRSTATSGAALSTSGNIGLEVTPTLATFDVQRGLLYLATTNKPRSTFGGASTDAAELSSHVTLKVFGVTIRRGNCFVLDGDSPTAFRLSVSISPAQNYVYPAGGSTSPLSCIAPCGASGRVATGSVSGILGVWLLQSDDSIQSLKQQQHVPSPVWPFGKGDSAPYVIGAQKPTAMAAVFEAEFNHDDSQLFEETDVKHSQIEQISSADEKQDVTLPLEIEVELSSPVGPGTMKKANSAVMSTRSPSWADSTKKRGGSRGTLTPDFAKSKAASFQSPNAARKADRVTEEVSSSAAKRPGLPRPASAKKGTPKKTGNKKNRDKLETSPTGSDDLPDFFDDINSPVKDASLGEPISLVVEGVAMRPADIPMEPPKIDLSELGKEISAAIKSPMPSRSEGVGILSPIRSGLSSPVIKSTGEKPPLRAKTASPEISEAAKERSVEPATQNEVSTSTTFLKLDLENPAGTESVVSQMEKSFCFDDFFGGKYHASDSANKAGSTLTREDFLNFSNADNEDVAAGISIAPADMLEAPHGAQELRARALCQRYAVAPDFSNEAQLLMTSDGNSISLQKTDGTPSILLNKPRSLAKSAAGFYKGVIRSVSISPSGALVAAIVDYHSPSLPKNIHPAELVVWCAGTTTDEDNEAPLHWLCLGTVHLQTGLGNRSTAGSSKLGWTHDDSLVLAVPVTVGGEAAAIGDRDEIALVGAPKSTNGCLISVTHWAETSAAQQSDENKAYVATRSKADGGIDMPGILTAVPFFNEKIAGMHVASWKEQNYLVGGESRPKQNSTIRVIFWAGKKICMFEISCPAATNSATAARKKSVCSPEVTLLWTDDTGNQAPYCGVSLGWPIDSVHTFFGREDVMVLGKAMTGQQSRESLSEIGLGDDSSAYYSSLCMPVPVIATLNGSGGLKFVRIRAFASTQTFVAKIPAAHTSGSPRNLSLSATGRTLTLAYPTAVQVYGAVHHMKEGQAYSIVLSFNYKVLLSFCPLYVSMLTSFRPREAAVSQRAIDNDDEESVMSAMSFSGAKSKARRTEDILVASSEGDIGVITSTTSVSKAAVSARDTKNSQHNEQFFRMGNAPGSIGLPSVSALNKNSRTGRSSTVYHRVVTIPEASIVASISKAGLLSLSHLESGIMLPFPESVAPTNCSAIAASKRLLAVGSACGRVCIYEARSMKVIKIVFLPGTGKSATSTRVVSLLFVSGIDDSDFLVSMLHDGSVCVSSVPTASRRINDENEGNGLEAGERVFRRISTHHLGRSGDHDVSVSDTGVGEKTAYLCDCHNDRNTFGVVRGDILDLFNIESAISISKSVDFVGGLTGPGAPKVSRIGRVRLLDEHCDDVKKGNPRSPSTLRVYDTHIRRMGRKLVVTSVSASVRSILQPTANVDMWLAVGAVDLQGWGGSTTASSKFDDNKVQNVAMVRRVALGLDYRQLVDRSGLRTGHGHYQHFSESTCHVFTSTGLLFLDLDRIHNNSEISMTNMSREYPAALDLKDISKGYVDFSSLCGSEHKSAVPGDGQRSLHDLSVVAVSRKVITKKCVGRNDVDSHVIDEVDDVPESRVVETAVICRSYPSPVMIRTDL